MNTNILLQLTWANIKMYFRDRGALFWTLFFPFIVIFIFGILDFAKFSTSSIGIVYTPETKDYALAVKDVITQIGDFYKVYEGDSESEMKALENNDRVIVLEFTPDKSSSKVNVMAYLNKANEQSGQSIFLMVQKVLADFELKMTQTPSIFSVKSEVVNVFNLRNIDFLVPGVIAMALMQGGIFGVVGTIVSYREKGILKRLFATPLSKGNFLVAQISARLLFSILQVAILLTTSYLVFHIRIVGNLFLVALLSIIGSLVFLSLGFVISGISKTQQAAEAMTMPVMMILMFTSGVYFSRDVLPNWLFKITAYTPLTYLADALRDVMTRGYSFTDSTVRTASIGVVVWLILMVLLAIKSFKWEK
jgi:ABC-2 type transport system permease protein